MNTILAAGGIPLGFDIVEVLLHMLNLAILLVAVRFLLYKPIKRFMDKRVDGYRASEEKSAAVKKESEQWKLEYGRLVESAKKEALDIERESKKSAQLQAAEIIEKAKKEAHDILEKATSDIEQQKSMLKEEMSASVSDLAVTIAAKVLQREIVSEDNDAIIDSVLQDWKGKQV